MAKITLNGVEVEVPEGTSVIAAADRAGVFIPRFCYHPDLKPVGNCRICQVEIEGSPRLTVSCMTPVKDGMVVRTDTEKVKKAVQGDLEFLLLNHPVDCPICDQAGECYLQDFYMQVGMHESRIPLPDKVRKRKVLDLGPMIVLDQERCVLCSRCIRFSDDVSKTSQFGFFNRGARMAIGTFRDRPLEDPYSGCYADVCPVGALTSNDFRFTSRVWFLKRTESVCPECSTGCNIRIDHKESTVYRFLPRRNEAVNQSWMCDQGRISYAANNVPERLRTSLLRTTGPLVATPFEGVVEAVAAELRAALAAGGPGSIAGIATPRASCEDLWLFRILMSDVVKTSDLDYRVDPACAQVEVREDAVLRRRDHNPNTRGAELLGMGKTAGDDGVRAILERAASGSVRVLYLLGPELLTRYPDQKLVEAAIEGAGFVVLHDTHARPAHDRMDAVLAVGTYAETDGTFVNYAPRIQRLTRAFPPPGAARTTVEALARVIEALGGPAVPREPRLVFRALAAQVPALGGLTYERIGPLGQPLGLEGASEEKAASA